MANLTLEQQAQLRINMEKIKDYLKTIVPDMKEAGFEYIDVSFNKGNCNVSLDNNGRVNGHVNGRFGGFNIYFDEDEKLSRDAIAAWRKYDYCVDLLIEWHDVKRGFLEKIERQREINRLVYDFEI